MQLTRRGCGAMLALLPWSRPPARAEPLPLACPGAWRPTDSGCVRTCVDSVDLAVLRPRRMHVHVPAVRAYQPAYRVPEALGSSLGAARTSRARRVCLGLGLACPPHTTRRTSRHTAPRQPQVSSLPSGAPNQNVAPLQYAGERERAYARLRACLLAKQARAPHPVTTRTPPCNHTRSSVA